MNNIEIFLLLIGYSLEICNYVNFISIYMIIEKSYLNSIKSVCMKNKSLSKSRETKRQYPICKKYSRMAYSYTRLTQSNNR